MDPPISPVPSITAESLGEAYTPLRDDHDDLYGVPTLEELGKAPIQYLLQKIFY